MSRLMARSSVLKATAFGARPLARHVWLVADGSRPHPLGTRPGGRAQLQVREQSGRYSSDERACARSRRVHRERNRRVGLRFTCFPTVKLGSGTDMLKSEDVEFFTLPPLILSTLVPNASLSGIGFAFPDNDLVWKVMD